MPRAEWYLVATGGSVAFWSFAPAIAIPLSGLIDGTNQAGGLNKDRCRYQLMNEDGAVGFLQLGHELSPK